MNPIIRKILIAIYFFIIIIASALILSGYSFSKDYLDYTIASITLIYPTILFIKYLIRKRPHPGLIIISLILICTFFYFVMFSFFVSKGTEIDRIKEWNIDNYNIVFTYRQDWVGPPYYRYYIKQYSVKKIFEKPLAESNSYSNQIDTCIVMFESLYEYNDPVYFFDTCKNKIEKRKNVR